MTPKELAKAIDELSLEDARKLVEELKALGYVAPEATTIAKEEVKEEVKTTFSLKLIEAGGKKLDVVKFWKNNSTLSLMESKAFIDTAPVILKENLSADEIKFFQTELEGLGATVQVV